MTPDPDSDPTPDDVTRLLHAWRGGDHAALDALVPIVYEELRRVAEARMRGEAADHTLQPTALVHETYARLAEAAVAWDDRAHFFAVAAGTMRRVLVDHARARGRAKRGGDRVQVTLVDGLAASDGPVDHDLLDLDAALERLADLDARKARIVELVFFTGLTQPEVADVLDISIATVERDLRAARAWLGAQLSG